MVSNLLILSSKSLSFVSVNVLNSTIDSRALRTFFILSEKTCSAHSISVPVSLVP